MARVYADASASDPASASGSTRPGSRFVFETRPIPFGVGDFVILHTPTAIRGVSSKLLNQFTGPFKVIAEHRLANGTVAPNV